ncbi:MAG: recombinase family protein [Oscillospiraceae bacterium]|nr:recombinase family protein [Oscillospiraceae bacterium]
MTTEKTVTKIQPTITPIAQPLKKKQKRNTAGYGRVSTDLSEQESSFEAQVEYYTRIIQANPEWHFCGVYADEGISGTSTKGREQFNRMIQDALDGKIQLIITKSVSRFARNTVDSLQTIRKLKDVGCEVYFEKEQIWTFDGKGELLLTIMASLAQEESRSISENVTWGKRRAFEAGKFSLPYKRFLGYEKGPDGRPQIVESEAAVVRTIYTLFLQGKTVNYIARHLTAQGIPTPGGKVKWSVSTIQSILRSEKYKGEAILQKAFTVDFLEKKRKKNEGEIPSFHVENSHPAIVTLEEFDLVQAELERRQRIAGPQQSGLSPYSSRLVCESCGAFFGPKTWHSTSPYRRVIWQCNRKYTGDTVCQTRHVKEDEIQRAFTQAFNSLISDRAAAYARHRAAVDEFTDTSALDHKIAKYIEECDVVAGLIRKAVDENASAAVDPDEYDERYNALVARFQALEEKRNGAQREKRSRELRRVQAAAFFAEVEAREGLLAGFDEQLWNCTVQSVTVLVGGGFRVRFKDQIEIEVTGK